MPVLNWIPCIGFIFGLLGVLVTLVVAPTGIGAVILTRFGTRPYTPRSDSYSGGGSPSTPTRGGYGHDTSFPDEDFSDLDINSASEAELKAKIKATLAEAGTTGQLDKDDEPAPSAKPGGKETPEPTQPDQPADDDGPEDDPDKKRGPAA